MDTSLPGPFPLNYFKKYYRKSETITVPGGGLKAELPEPLPHFHKGC